MIKKKDKQPQAGKRKKPVSKSTVTGTDSAKWLEMALAIDHTVIKFHGKQHVQQYVLTLLNIASLITEFIIFSFNNSESMKLCYYFRWRM